MKQNREYRVHRLFLLTAVVFASISMMQAQEVHNDFEARTYIEIGFKPVDKLKIKFIPEVRFDKEFSIGEYLLETEALYKPLDFLSIGGAYRFVINPRDSKSTEYLHRYALITKLSKEFGRLDPALILSYTNYADDEATDKEFLRYKASLKYDIASCKITPKVAAEAFQQLDDNSFYKMRYTLGMDYKLMKNNFLGISYKLDYYKHELRNKNMICLGYKIKF